MPFHISLSTLVLFMCTHTELYIRMYACKELLGKLLYANDLGNRILYVRMQTHAHTHTHTLYVHIAS